MRVYTHSHTYMNVISAGPHVTHCISPHNLLLSLGIIFYPIDVLRNARVYTRIARLAAFVAERDDPYLGPSVLDSQHQRSTRVTLTGVLAALTVTGAQKIASDRLKVSRIAVLVSPHRQDRLSLDCTLLSTCWASSLVCSLDDEER